MAGYWHEPAVPSNLTFAKGEATLDEIMEAARDNMIFVDNTVSKIAAHEKAYDERIEAVKQATGVALENPYRKAMPSRQELKEMSRINATSDAINLVDYRHDKFARDLDELARNHPAQKDEVRADIPISIDALRIANEAGTRFEELAASRDGIGGVLAGFAGGITGAMHDPFQLMTLALGAGPGTARTIGGRILQTAVSEAAINAGVEAAMQPQVQAWRKTVGLPNGWSEAARNVLFAGALGGVLGGAGKAVGEGLNVAFPKVPDDAPIRAALDDGEKAAEILGPIRDTLDAPARGALDHAELERAEGLKSEGEQQQAFDDIMARASERANNPDTVEALPVDEQADAAILPARGIDDPAGADVAAQVDAQLALRVERSSDGAQNELVQNVAPQMFDAGELKIDAKRFQFKEGGDAAGVTDRLQGVQKWQPERSGVIIVFEDKAGKQFVADGHQRAGLAKRIGEANGEKIELPGYIYREADGFSAEDVRLIAAMKNIAEGSGSPIDAAKVLRTGQSDLISDLPPSSALVRDAAGLTKLSDDAFTMAVNEVVKPQLAAVVGRLVANENLHADMLQVLKREKARTIGDAESMVRDMMAVETVTHKQDSLFGSEEVERMLLKERAQVRASALNTLKKDKQVFAMLTREEGLVSGAGNVLDNAGNAKRADSDATLIEIIEKLVNRAGPVADAFNNAAKAVAGGESAARAARTFVEAVRGEIERSGGDFGIAGRAGSRTERGSETGVDDKQQLLIDGVDAVSDSDRLRLAAEKRISGNNDEMDIGLFGDGKDQTDIADLLVPEPARQGDNGELSGSARPLKEIVEEADELTDLADIVRNCKT